MTAYDQDEYNVMLLIRLPDGGVTAIGAEVTYTGRSEIHRRAVNTGSVPDGIPITQLIDRFFAGDPVSPSTVATCIAAHWALQGGPDSGEIKSIVVYVPINRACRTHGFKYPINPYDKRALNELANELDQFELMVKGSQNGIIH
jgi:hypothetical protein